MLSLRASCLCVSSCFYILVVLLFLTFHGRLHTDRAHILPSLAGLGESPAAGSMHFRSRTRIRIRTRTPTTPAPPGDFWLRYLSAGRSQEQLVQLLYKRARLIPNQVSGFRMASSLLHNLQVLRTRRFARKLRPESCAECFRIDFGVLINATEVCGGNLGITLLMLITTVPGNVRERRAVRETWAGNNTRSAGIRHVFLFGNGWSAGEQRLINTESGQFGDVLQMDFIDSYYNLSYKVFTALKWARDECPQARNILRTADDNYINAPNMLALCQNRTSMVDDIGSQTLRGLCFPPKLAERGVVNKHSVSYLEWPRERLYPPYCEGTAFLMTSRVAGRLLSACGGVPYFPLEDVHVGMVARRAGVLVESVRGFRTEVGSDDCQHSASMHEVAPDRMKAMWERCGK